MQTRLYRAILALLLVLSGMNKPAYSESSSEELEHIDLMDEFLEPDFNFVRPERYKLNACKEQKKKVIKQKKHE